MLCVTEQSKIILVKRRHAFYNNLGSLLHGKRVSAIFVISITPHHSLYLKISYEELITRQKALSLYQNRSLYLQDILFYLSFYWFCITMQQDLTKILIKQTV